MEGEKGGVNRRDFLTIGTSALAALGVGAAAIPFIMAMSPTKDLIEAGVMDIDVAGMREGELRVIMWRRQPIFVLRRTQEMIVKANQNNPARLRDPATAEERVSIPEWYVSIAICTHLGCIPSWQPEKIPGLEQPGFYCPCHGGKFDTLGRRLDGPPPENLHLVPYEFVANNKLRIGTVTFAGFGEDIRKIQELPKVNV